MFDNCFTIGFSCPILFKPLRLSSASSWSKLSPNLQNQWNAYWKVFEFRIFCHIQPIQGGCGLVKSHLDMCFLITVVSPGEGRSMKSHINQLAVIQEVRKTIICWERSLGLVALFVSKFVEITQAQPSFRIQVSRYPGALVISMFHGACQFLDGNKSSSVSSLYFRIP